MIGFVAVMDNWFVFFYRKWAINKAMFRAIATRSAGSRVGAMIFRLFLFNCFIRFPVGCERISEACARASFADGALIGFVIGTATGSFAEGRFFMEVLCNGESPSRIIGYSKWSLAGMAAYLCNFFNMVAGLFRGVRRYISLFAVLSFKF